MWATSSLLASRCVDRPLVMGSPCWPPEVSPAAARGCCVVTGSEDAPSVTVWEGEARRGGDGKGGSRRRWSGESERARGKDARGNKDASGRGDRDDIG